MARNDDNLSADESAQRSVARTIANTVLAIALVAGLGAWWWLLRPPTELYPGQAAIILRLGEYERTVSSEGLKFHLPAPLETHEIVTVAELRKEEFGVGGVTEGATDTAAIQEASMQTQDNAIVRLSFVVQYKFKDAFKSRYSLHDPRAILRDAAQAAMREVVGQHDHRGRALGEAGRRRDRRPSGSSRRPSTHTIPGFSSPRCSCRRCSRPRR